jgi:hypothetical protein
LLMACGRLNPSPDYVIVRSASNGPEPVEGLMACGRLNPSPDYVLVRSASNGPEPVEGLMACGRHTRTR